MNKTTAKRARKAYKNGCRLEVPKSLESPHLFYQATAHIGDLEDRRRIVEAAKRFVDDCPLESAQIEAMSRDQAEARAPGCLTAIAKIALGIGLTEYESLNNVAITMCEWASVHVDAMFAGKAFVSVVLNTGPHPYVMQTMHSEIRKDEGGPYLAVVTTSSQLNVGDIIVFDPTTPHMASPKFPGPDQLLVLLQFEIDDYSDRDRASLLERFSQKQNSASYRGAFDGFRVGE